MVAILGLAGIILASLIKILPDYLKSSGSIALDVNISSPIYKTLNKKGIFHFIPKYEEIYEKQSVFNSDLIAPYLNLFITNNSDESILVSKIFLEIKESLPDTFPRLVVASGSAQDGYLFSIGIHNDGWGIAKDVSLQFDIIPNTGVESFYWDQNVTSETTFKFSKFTGNVASETDVKIWDEVSSLGHKVKALRVYDSLAYESKSIDKSLNKTIQQARDFFIQTFGAGNAHVRGKMKYYGHELDGSIASNSILFNRLVYFVPTPMGSVEHIDEAEAYKFSSLELDSSNYQAGISVSHLIKPGEAERIGLRLTAPESSHHKAKLCIVYNGNKILRSDMFNIRLLISKSYLKYNTINKYEASDHFFLIK